MLLASRSSAFRVLSMMLGAVVWTALAGESMRAHAANPAVEAVKTAISGNAAAASGLARRSGDPAAAKLVEWVNVTENWKAVGYDRIMAFVAANPGWPSMDLIKRRAEWLLFTGRPGREQVLKHFAAHAPVSHEGRVALARALQAGGEAKRAAALIAEAWADPRLSAAAQKAIQSEFRTVLTRAVLEARLWRLIYAQEASAAEQAGKLISAEHAAAAHAAAGLIKEKKWGLDHYNDLPAEMRNKRAVQYALERYYRRTEQTDKARDILLNTPSDHAELVDPEAWWIERRIVVRQSIGPKNKKHWPAAYKIAAAHGFSSGPHHSEGEFLAGWIALRMLDDPKTALKHFSAIPGGADNRTEASRGHYWTGRAWLALGDETKAGAAFAAAAESPTLYYGQLAREALGLGKKPVPLKVGNPSDTTRAAVNKNELVRAFRLLADAGADRHLGLFVWPIAASLSNADEAAAAAAVIDAKGGTFLSLRFAKAASAHNADIDDWGYPRHALPQWSHRGHPVENAIVLGLTRQESEFNAVAGSHAGARGLMQIMPGTAVMIARQHKVQYSEKRLTSDPAYNVMLGAAHLGDLIAGYEGSYILSLVAYNAGPRRVREWIEMYGDPRHEVDPIDWVEAVPFTETRKYIQKVLQNVQVYRSRLDPANAQPLSADLGRGGTPPRVPILTAKGEAEIEPAACEEVAQANIADLIESC